MMNAIELKRVSDEAYAEQLRQAAIKAEKIRKLSKEQTEKTCEYIGEQIEEQAKKGSNRIFLTFLFCPEYREDKYYRLMVLGGHYANGKSFSCCKFAYVYLEDVVSFLENHGLSITLTKHKEYWAYGTGRHYDGTALQVDLKIR